MTAAAMALREVTAHILKMVINARFCCLVSKRTISWVQLAVQSNKICEVASISVWMVALTQACCLWCPMSFVGISEVSVPVECKPSLLMFGRIVVSTPPAEYIATLLSLSPTQTISAVVEPRSAPSNAGTPHGSPSLTSKISKAKK